MRKDNRSATNDSMINNNESVIDIKVNEKSKLTNSHIKE